MENLLFSYMFRFQSPSMAIRVGLLRSQIAFLHLSEGLGKMFSALYFLYGFDRASVENTSPTLSFMFIPLRPDSSLRISL